MSWAVDAHCHISDLRIFPRRKEWIARCSERGVRWFILGGVNPLEWDRQLQLHSEFPDKIFCCFGLHPYFLRDAPREDLDRAFAALPEKLAQSDFLGETGLDFRKEIVADRREWQIEFFEKQLLLAQQLDKICVLHVVRAHEEALGLLRAHPVRGLVHAFNSSWEVAEKYLAQGLYLSLGARVLNPEHSRLLENIPLNRLLLESDAPDQPPRGLKEHDSTTLFLLAQAVADNKGLTADDVLEKTRLNLETLLGRSLT